MQSPIINLIYYKHILDLVMIKVFDIFNDDFKKIGDYYVLSSNISKSKLEKILKELFINELKLIVKEWDILNPKYYIIIGSCLPKDNILLNFRKENEYFSDKLSNLIYSDHQFKYILKEHDIRINLSIFNDIFCSIFNQFFNHQNIISILGNSFQNVFFIMHKNIDCYSMFKILKYIYGGNSINNLFLMSLKNNKEYKEILLSINEIINKYVHNKNQMNKSPKFKRIVNEIQNFINEWRIQ